MQPRRYRLSACKHLCVVAGLKWLIHDSSSHEADGDVLDTGCAGDQGDALGDQAGLGQPSVTASREQRNAFLATHPLRLTGRRNDAHYSA